MCLYFLNNNNIYIYIYHLICLNRRIESNGDMLFDKWLSKMYDKRINALDMLEVKMNDKGRRMLYCFEGV